MGFYLGLHEKIVLHFCLVALLGTALHMSCVRASSLPKSVPYGQKWVLLVTYHLKRAITLRGNGNGRQNGNACRPILAEWLEPQNCSNRLLAVIFTYSW